MSGGHDLGLLLVHPSYIWSVWICLQQGGGEVRVFGHFRAWLLRFLWYILLFWDLFPETCHNNFIWVYLQVSKKESESKEKIC